MTNGEPTLNGFPITCDRQERFQFDNLDFWFPLAFVNRLDLAPQNGAHCGQQRMVFGNNEQGRTRRDAGVGPVDPAPGDGDDDDPGIPASPPAPVFEPVLPDADTPTEELVGQDQEEREVFGEETIGGQSAQVTH